MEITLILVALALFMVFVGRPLRRYMFRNSPGQLGQLEFKRIHGARVLELVGGGAGQDPRRGSPWIHVMLGPHDARMCAARLRTGRWQAGVAMYDLLVPVEIWATGAGDEPRDFEALEEVDGRRAEELVARLGELGVDSVASGALGGHVPPTVRVQFDDVEALADLFARIVPVLEELAALAPPSAQPDSDAAT